MYSMYNMAEHLLYLSALQLSRLLCVWALLGIDRCTDVAGLPPMAPLILLAYYIPYCYSHTNCATKLDKYVD